MTTCFFGWRCAAAKLQGGVWCVSIGVQRCRQDCGSTRCSLSSYPHGYVTVFGVRQCGCQQSSITPCPPSPIMCDKLHHLQAPHQIRLPRGVTYLQLAHACTIVCCAIRAELLLLLRLRHSLRASQHLRKEGAGWRRRAAPANANASAKSQSCGQTHWITACKSRWALTLCVWEYLGVLAAAGCWRATALPRA